MGQGGAASRASWGDRFAAWLSARARPAGGFVTPPEPRSIGLYARGRQLTAGNFLLAGHMVETHTPWDIDPPSAAFAAELHGFGWLDHLAAAGDRAARQAAQGWVSDWIARYGRGGGPGWVPDLTGRRMIRWINHALFLTAGREPGANEEFLAALGRQTAYLARRWTVANPGLARFEATTGLLVAALSLMGLERHIGPALAALEFACEHDIDAEGAIPGRNPEELLEIFALLVWAGAALADAGKPVPAALEKAIGRIAPTLRSLRHADGGLARFHGGGRGMEGRLDRALADAAPLAGSGRRPLAMGYARLDGARTSVIVDAAAPPGGAGARMAHASTLAFELTSNRRALVVSCGSGLSFGPEWEKAGRATLSHSTLSIDGFSSARFGKVSRPDEGAAPLVDGPRTVTLHRTDERHATAVLMSHDGYVETHGLTHIRNLDLSADGRALLGEDTLAALEPAHRRRFEQVLDRGRLRGVTYALRFHLHPECDPSLDMNGAAVSVALPSGEVWVFRFDGPGKMSLEPSVYLEPGRLAPRPAQQIVVRAAILDHTSQINWTLAKAQDTPLAIRDTGRDEELALPRDLFMTD